MNPDEIKDFVLLFFQKIGANVVENNGVYEISLPEKFRADFESSKLIITFDKDISSEQNCSLIILGSGILTRIIRICQRQGPITLRKTKSDTGDMIIRYHFFVHFYGLATMSKLEYVDVSIKTLKIVKAADIFGSDFPIENTISENITPSYIAALTEIKKLNLETSTKFFTDANKKFRHDFKLFVDKYDAQIKELDHAINKKEENLADFDKIKEFRFKIVDSIKELEKEKLRLIETLQEKHKINFEYNLVACELITA